MPTAQPRRAVERKHDAQEDAGGARLEVDERAEEGPVLTAEVAGPGEVQPVDGAAGLGDGEVGHAHEHLVVARLVHRPLGEGAVAEVVADERLLGDQPREGRHRAGETVPGALVGPGEHALDVLGLVGAVPLDREVLGRDRVEQAWQLTPDQILVACLGLGVVGGKVSLEGVHCARWERKPDLKAQPGRDHPSVAQFAETVRMTRSPRRSAARSRGRSSRRRRAR